MALRWRSSVLPTHKLEGLVDPPYRFTDPVFGPTETAAGNMLRLTAITVIEKRIAALVARRNTQRLTNVETRELQDNQAAIRTLNEMAPVAGLVPPRAVDLSSGH